MRLLVVLSLIAGCVGCSHQRVVQSAIPPAWPHAFITTDISAFPEIAARKAYIVEASLRYGGPPKRLELGPDKNHYFFERGNHRLKYGCSGLLNEFPTYFQVKLEAGKKYLLYCQGKDVYFRPKLIEVPNYAIKVTAE